MTDEESRKAFIETVADPRLLPKGRSGYAPDRFSSRDTQSAWDIWKLAIAWMQSQQEWRAMDSAPRDGSSFLARWKDSECMTVVQYDDDPPSPDMTWDALDIHYHENSFSHWLPLPPLPKEGKE